MIGLFREYSFLLPRYHFAFVRSPAGGEAPRFLRLTRMEYGPVQKSSPTRR
jgi:hypothetical protein